MSQPLSGVTKVGLGVVLPMTGFVLFDLLLFRSVGGKGEDLGFAGMALFFRSFIIVPVLFVVNALLMRRNWKSKSLVLFAGFVPPTAVALYQYISLYGPW
jgi:hypothetical protein